MAGYSHTTFGQAKTLLGQRLDDTGPVQFWADAERGFYIRSALRSFNSIGRFQKNQFPVMSAPSTTFYDLMNAVQNPGTLLAPTITDQYLINEMQCLLMEPLNTWTGITSGPGYTWNGTAQFTMADMVGALQRKRDEFLLLTGVVQTALGDLNAGPPPVQNVQLADTIIDVRRAAWKDITSILNGTGPATYYPLTRSDKLSFDYGQIGWNLNPATPFAYSVSDDPLLTLQLAPIAEINGAVNLVAVTSGPALDVTANSGAGTVLGIPDDFCWIVMFGALFDLLNRDGEARDEARAQYAEQRWEQGVEIARLASSVLRAEIDGLAAPISSAYAADHSFPTWQNGTGVPTNLIQFSYNLIAMTPQPTTKTHEVTIDAVINAQVPVNDAAFLQVGREHLDTILNEAQHLAAFKQGDDELQATASLHQQFMNVTVDNNSRLKANMKQFRPAMQTAQRDLMQRPMREVAA